MTTDLDTATATDRYQRGMQTVLGCWTEFARGAPRAAVRRHPGVAVAVFPEGPERAVYNNAVLDRGRTALERADAVAAMEAEYAAAGVPEFAAWVHESDRAMCRDLERRGYALAEATRAMGMTLDGARLPRPAIDLAPVDWAEYLRVLQVPPDLLRRVDQSVFHVVIARLDGENVAAAMAYDLDGDCGVYNVVTLPHARRRGLGTAVTATLVHDALARGARTASLQSSAMGERVYAGVGFRDLGRILEYAPGRRVASAAHAGTGGRILRGRT